MQTLSYLFSVSLRQLLLQHLIFINYFSSTIIKFYSVLDVVSAYLRFFQKNHFFFFSFFKQYETLHEFAWYPCAGSVFFSLQREPGFLRSAFVFLELPSHFVSPVLSVSYVPMESSASAGLNSRDSGQIRCKNKGSRKLECVVNT